MFVGFAHATELCYVNKKYQNFFLVLYPDSEPIQNVNLNVK